MKSKKLQHAIGNGNKEIVTIIEMIIASRETLSSMIIYKRKYFMESWLL